MKEQSIQAETMVSLSQHGHYCLRVNSGEFWGGKMIGHDGLHVMLEHPTRIHGAPPGTSDLIGCITRTITPEMVGRRIAQLFCIEMKRPGDKPEKHQERYLAMMRSRGALAGVATSADSALKILEGSEPV